MSCSRDLTCWGRRAAVRGPRNQLAVPLEDLHLRTDVLIGGLTALPVAW
jgi:hypothetical protein